MTAFRRNPRQLRLAAYTTYTLIGTAILLRLLAPLVFLLLVSCASLEKPDYPVHPLPSPDASGLKELARQKLIDLSNTLLSLRTEENYWPGPQETDATIELPLLILNRVLEINDPELQAEGISRILSTQDQNTGLWSHSHGGPANVSNTGTLLLTLRFLDPLLVATPLMQEAEQWFLEQGGSERISLFHKLLLTVGGVLPSGHLPNFSPNILAVPKGTPVNIFNLGMARAFFIPLSVWSYYQRINQSGLQATKLTGKDLADGFGQNFGKPFKAGVLPKQLFKKYSTPDKRNALYVIGDLTRRMTPGDEEYWAKQALAWMIQGQSVNGIWAGTSLTSFVALMALHEAHKASVYDFTPWLEKGFQGLARWKIELKNGQVISQPFPGPVMDTARALDSYYSARHTVPAAHREVQSSIKWLIAQQTSGTGDGQFLHHQDTELGGWAFQIGNPYYPDHDDTAMVLLSLLQSAKQMPVDHPDYATLNASIDKGLEWLLTRQNTDGGFAAWSKNSSRVFSFITRKGLGGAPEVNDQSQPDVTSRVLRTLSFLEQSNLSSDIDITESKLQEVIRKSCRFLEKESKHVAGIPIKVWRGDWFVNYFYASSEVLTALLTSGCWKVEDAKDIVTWIIESQNSDGGWGESNESIELGRFVPDQSTVSQTLFTTNALIHYERARLEHAAYLPSVRPSIDAAVRYLLNSTRGENFPEEEHYSGVFIKGVWYGRYIHAPHYELVKVLGQYLKL